MTVAFRLIFVRHGETYANLLKRVQGTTDEPISEIGIKQAIEAGKSLRNIKFDRIYASPLSRAFITCEKIVGENENPAIEIKTDERLMERRFGVFEGQQFDVCEKILKEKEPRKSWLNYTPEGAETPSEVQERFVKFFKELCQSVYDKNKSANSKVEQKEVKSVAKNTSEDKNKEIPTKDKIMSTDENKEEISVDKNTSENDQEPACIDKNNSTADNKEEEADIDKNGSLMNDFESLVENECILIVSHGYALYQLYNHFAHSLSCRNFRREDVNRLSSNTGISEFVVRYSPKKYDLKCIRIHDSSHLKNKKS